MPGFWRSLCVIGSRAGAHVLWRRDCEAQWVTHSLWAVYSPRLWLRTAFAPNITKNSLTCAKQPCRREWRALITKVPFLSFLPPPSINHPTSFSFSHPHTVFVPWPSLSLSFTLELTSWRLISAGRTPPPPPTPLVVLLDFYFPPLVFSSTEQARSLCAFCYYWCLMCSTLNRGRGQFSLHWRCQ